MKAKAAPAGDCTADRSLTNRATGVIEWLPRSLASPPSFSTPSDRPSADVERIWDPIDDPELKGFGVAISPSHQKTFFLGFTSPQDGARRFYPCGKYVGGDSLSQARQKAREARRQIAANVDPVLADAEQKRATEPVGPAGRAGHKFADLLDAYVALMRKEGKPSADEIERSFDTDVKPFPWTEKAALKAKGRVMPPAGAAPPRRQGRPRRHHRRHP